MTWSQFNPPESGNLPRPGRKKRKRWVVVLSGAIVVVLFLFALPAFTPGWLRGDFVDATVVPEADGHDRVWIVADGSFKYIVTTESPGESSTGPGCMFCKAWLYAYDPSRELVVGRFEIDDPGVVLSRHIAFADDKVWVISDRYDDAPARIDAYNPHTLTPLFDTSGFLKQHPELSAGITSLRYENANTTVDFELRDGTQRTFALDKNAFVERSFPPSDAQRPQLRALDTGSRQGLFRDNERLGSGVYLEGKIYWQNASDLFIIHVDQVDKKAKRLLTRVDAETGQNVWTAGSLLPAMNIDYDEDPFSSVASSSNNLRITTTPKAVMVVMDAVGFIGFEFATGKLLWKREL
ncbi:MAG TPA: hypothetical protein VHM70_27255 [Polyangiaceae bacterium]|jgi:hypothetical protein|nr:hypothetical protein [Polyangiaceae bacterium]